MNTRVIVVREVSDEKLLREPAKRFLDDCMKHFHEKIADRAPWDTGNLQGALQPGSGVTRVLDEAAIVGVAGKKGGRGKKKRSAQVYGLALDQPKARNPHYRATAWKGNKTAGWFDRGVDDAMPGLTDKLVPQLAADIEAAWRA